MKSLITSKPSFFPISIYYISENPLCLWVLQKELKNTSLKVIDFFAILSLEYISSRVNTTLILFKYVPKYYIIIYIILY